MDSKIILIFLIIFLVPVPVFAVSGNVSVVDEVIKSDFTGYGSGYAGASPNWSTLGFAYNSYNRIYQLRLKSNNLGFPYDSNTATFDVVSGGTGSGVVSYNKSVKEITWYFYDTTATASTLVLRYSVNIFSGVTTGNNYVDNGGLVSSTKPFCLRYSNAGSCVATFTGYNDYSTHHYADVGNIVSNQWNITYYAAGLVNVSVVKGAIGTRINFTDSAGSLYAGESSVNTNIYNPSFYQGNEIWIDATLTSGSHGYALINGSQYPPPPDAVPEWIAKATRNGINYDFKACSLGVKGYFYMIGADNLNHYASYVDPDECSDFTLSVSEMLGAGGAGLWTFAIFDANDTAVSKSFTQFILSSDPNIWVNFTSAPVSGANLYIDGVYKGQTPLTLDMTVYDGFTLGLRKSGYCEDTSRHRVSFNTTINRVLVSNENGCYGTGGNSTENFTWGENPNNETSMYGFFVWLVTPIHDLRTNVQLITETYQNSSVSSSNGVLIPVVSAMMGALPSKVKAIGTYYLVCLIILMLLGRG